MCAVDCLDWAGENLDSSQTNGGVEKGLDLHVCGWFGSLI